MLTALQVNLKWAVDLHSVAWKLPIEATGHFDPTILSDRHMVQLFNADPADGRIAADLRQLQRTGHSGLRQLNLERQGLKKLLARWVTLSRACR